MPRQARVKSNSGIYHVMTRGINKEEIFKTSIDKNTVMDIIKGIMTDIGYCIIAYCIMDNHLHLLMKVDYSKLEILMKRLNI
jgi:REP element-mobilizing transposase RayT